ncbi:MAG: ATP-grasp domain-containing protein [candidate division KSB1 bacterium]|nr:ATP-grasp domain-containing protein [candidate division KSB1 bacterium]MDZ7304270.1 ATP-grasp domain-containing protein [candidate division KSB1 bacterium]
MPVEDAFDIRQIILLYNIDMSWPESDQKYVVHLANNMLAGLERFGFTVHPIAVRHDLNVLDRYDPRQWLVFNWCEGYEGMPWSDALVAKDLEERGFIFTGSDSKTLALSQDKWRVKKNLVTSGVPTPPGMVLDENMPANQWNEFPAVVKPVNQHGSFGVTRDSVVKSSRELIRQVRWVKKNFGCASLIEPFLDDREFQVAVWGNHKLQALPAMELDYSAFVEPGDRLYTFDSKFDPASPGWSGIKWYCPAPIDRAFQQELENIAVTAFRALRCRDYARIDIRLSKGRPMVLDVNPNPDLDPTSVFPSAAETIGLDYAAMTVRILELAAVRLRRRLSARKAKTTRALSFAESLAV